MAAQALRIPIFPLGLVLYPNEMLPLHIFEPRYKEMIAYCEATEEPFGVVFFAEGKVAHVGSTATIRKVVKRHDDGRLDLIVKGKMRFRLQKLYHDKAYLQADIERFEEPDEERDAVARERAITQHMRLLELAGRTVRSSLYQDQPCVSYVLAHNSGLNNEQKQELLETAGENERLQFLSAHYEEIIPRIMQAETLRKKIQSNGHFRDFPPELE